MDRSEEQLAELAAWRRKKNLNSEKSSASKFTDDTLEPPKTYHFFNYDPEHGPTDLSHICLKRNNTRDVAIFSIPLSFTEKARTVYKYNDISEFGLDIKTFLQPGCNAFVYNNN